MNSNLYFNEIAWRSEVGLHREGNEDSGLVSKTLVAVADGMGGYVGGEIASSTVIRKLEATLPLISNEEIDQQSREEFLRSSVEDMDSAIAKIAEERPELSGMGTTLTALTLIGSSAVLLHIGDSRAYRIRGKTITQLSHDHTVVQELIDQGRITSDEVADHPQRSFLSQALMGQKNLQPALLAFPLEKDDIFLLCSDGLTNVVDEAAIAQAFTNSLEGAVNSLVDLTYKNGAPDNVTVIAVRIGNSKYEGKTVFVGAAS